MGRTIISSPSNNIYTDEKEKTKMMSRYAKVISAVKDVLEDDELMGKICAFKQNEMSDCYASQKLKWRLNQLIENSEFQNKTRSHMPLDLQNLFQNSIDDHGYVDLANIKR